MEGRTKGHADEPVQHQLRVQILAHLRQRSGPGLVEGRARGLRVGEEPVEAALLGAHLLEHVHEVRGGVLPQLRRRADLGRLLLDHLRLDLLLHLRLVVAPAVDDQHPQAVLDNVIDRHLDLPLESHLRVRATHRLDRLLLLGVVFRLLHPFAVSAVEVQVDELVPCEHPVAQGELHHAEDDLLLGERLDEILQPAVARGDAFHAVELLVALHSMPG